jgi:hypothetical protein
VKILVMDSIPAACLTLARGLNETLGHETRCASSTVEALRWLKIEKDAIGVVVFFLEADPETGLSFIRKIRDFSEAAAYRPPCFVALTPGTLRDGYEGRLRAMRAECLLHGNVQQVYSTVRRLIFDATCERGRPTIVVDRSGRYTKFNLLGPAHSVLLPYVPSLLPTMNYFAVNFGTLLSISMLAEASDITIGTGRVYVKRLRDGYDEVRAEAGVDIPGQEVFYTSRKGGAFVYTLKARVLFN